jgi:tape measure domain-containing protein
MASEIIDIRIREDGARVVSRNIEGMGASARRAELALRSLQRALTGVIATMVLKKLYDTINAFQTMQNKLRVVTNSTGELNRVTKDLFNLAQRSRSDLGATANLYSRLSLSTKELGVSQRELFQFTETLSKAIVVSGANATEASAGLIQFSQALASGRLQGDELRSVLEQLPVVADIIAKQFGVTRGEIRALGAAGKLTTDQILEGFRKAADDIDKRFAKTVPTLSQSLTVLSNSFTMFVARLDEGTGPSKALAAEIKKLSDLMQDPEFQAGVLELAKIFVVLARAAGKALEIVGNSIRGAIKAQEDLQDYLFGGIIGTVSERRNAAAARRNESNHAAAKRGVKGTPLASITPSGVGGGGGGGGGKGGADQLQNALEAIMRTADPVRAAMMELTEQENTLNSAMKAGLITGEEKATLLARLTELAYEHLDPLGYMIKEMEKEGQLLMLDANLRDTASESIARLNSLKKDGVTITQETVDTITQEVAALQLLARVREQADQIAMQGSAGLQAQKELVMANNLAYQQGAITLQQYSNNLRNVGLEILRLNLDAGTATFSDSILAGLGSVIEGFRGVGVELSNIFGTFFQQLTDGFANVVGQMVTGQTTLQEGFHQLAKSILSDLIGALVKLGIQWVLNATIGQALAQLAVATTTAEAAIVAGAWAPAAALASLATLGTNAAPAAAAVTGTIALTKGLASAGGLGFAEGGFVSGPGTATSDSIAARLSNGEFVVNAAATAANRGLLESINNGAVGYARGGYVGSNNRSGPAMGGGELNIEIHNYSGAKVETKQLSPNDVLIMIREEAPKVIAGQIGEPNSKVSKAFSRSTTANRKRS